MSKTDQNLRDSIARNEGRAFWSAAAVVVGLILEVIFAAAFHEPPETFWSHWGPVGADVLVALGVAGEVLFGRRARGDSEELTRRSEDRLTEATTRAGDAMVRAAEADQKAAEARLELARFREPRYLTSKQQMAISEKLRPFAGSIFDIGWSMGASEQQDFAWVLEPTLTEAGWTQIDWSDGGPLYIYRGGHRPIAGIVSVADVSIQLHPGSEASLSPAALTLAEALQEEGIPAAVDPFNVRSINENAIHVMIGIKR